MVKRRILVYTEFVDMSGIDEFCVIFGRKDKNDLNNQSKTQLKLYAYELGIKNYSKMNKDQLIGKILKR